MFRFMIMFIIACSLLFTGCSENKDQTSEQNDIEYRKLSTNGITEQRLSNQTKEQLNKHEEIKMVHAVNTKDLLVTAFEVSHFNRFKLAKLRNKVTKELEKEFPGLEVTVSTDKKIILELQKLETNLQSQSLSQEKLAKQLKKIKELSQEET